MLFVVVVVYCMMIVGWCCVLCDARRLWFVVRWLFVCALVVVCRALLAVCCSLFDVCSVLFVYCKLSYVVCLLMFVVVWCLLFVVR